MSLCWLFHQWGKWERYDWHGYLYPVRTIDYKIEVNETRQKRQCLRCGKWQDEEVVGR